MTDVSGVQKVLESDKMAAAAKLASLFGTMLMGLLVYMSATALADIKEIRTSVYELHTKQVVAATELSNMKWRLDQAELRINSVADAQRRMSQ